MESEIRHLETQMERLEKGELDPELFKKIRLQYGVYSMRRAPTAYMVRIRVPLGIITPDQLKELAGILEEFTPEARGHLTTRQDVQIYGVERRRVPALLRGLARMGLTTREASGNVVRNVTLCPWAGVSVEEPFDITPAAQAVSGYLLRNPLTQILPRKVKIAFEGCPEDHARTAIHDIGIVAAVEAGRAGFRIYAGGGLGSAPRSAQLVESWTSPEHLLPTLEAILRIFERHGERRDRARSRLKFLVESLGWAEFQKRVLEERRIVWATQSGRTLDLLKDEIAPDTKSGTVLAEVARMRTVPGNDRPGDAAFQHWAATNAASQKQTGFVSVIARVPLGDVTAWQLKGVAALARRHKSEIRITNEQNLMLRFVPATELTEVYEELKRLGLAESGAGRLADITRCPGADSCLSAVTRPRGLAQALEEKFHNGLSPFSDERMSIKISGCPNSCGHHLIADLGFFGVAFKAGERHVPCYQILVGGRTREGEARFGERLIRVPARRAPEAVKRLMQVYEKKRAPSENFSAFAERLGLAALKRELEDLADLSRAAEAPELFTDLGADEPFQLDAGKGECAE